MSAASWHRVAAVVVAPPLRPEICPCGSGHPFRICCEPLHRRSRKAATALQLMRARYSAFATADGDFLSWTWHPRTRPLPLDLAADQVWLGLNVLRTKQGGHRDTTGVVEFVAHFCIGERVGSVHETSRFERLEGRWVYVAEA